MSSIHQEERLNASPERVFEAYMIEIEHSTFTGKPAEISREEGGSFSVHGGAVQGRNIELATNQRIVQAWRVGLWPEGVYSVIKVELKAEGINKTLYPRPHWLSRGGA
jgi:uncharacterized protein YndB with AHSA1/START domain